MKVFKFGGASVKDAAAVKNVANIMAGFKDEKIVLVVSAMGKSTNALEELLDAHYQQEKQKGILFDKVKKTHFDLMSELFPSDHEVFSKVNDLWVEADWILEEEPHADYNYQYDQIVSLGELVSSTILSEYFNYQEINNIWLDARDVITTDERYREATVIWEQVEVNAKEKVLPMFEVNNLVVTQGFIGSTRDNNTTTLGREGSDYSAAIFAFALDVESMSIWKDVPGILSADPKHFDNVTPINRLSYKEAVEMTYYGAKVIHPKTIKPIQNKQIPMYVKSFIDPSIDGTLINDMDELTLPPIIVLADNQTMLHISSNDFSFIGEKHLGAIFTMLAKHHLTINMMQNTAISFSVCLSQEESKLAQFMVDLGNTFSVTRDKDLELITIRHYNQKTIDEMKKGKVILFEEKIRKTLRMVVKDAPVMRRK